MQLLAFCSVSNKLLTTTVCFGVQGCMMTLKVICLDLTEIYWQGRGKEEEESGKEEQKVALQVWDEPIAG